MRNYLIYTRLFSSIWISGLLLPKNHVINKFDYTLVLRCRVN